MARRVASNGAGSAPKERKLDGAVVPADVDAEGDEVTRCLCGNQDFVQTPKTKAMHANPGLYVQCERCNVWQHGFCMGFMAEKEIPNEYYCELCEPSFHRISQRNGLLLSRYRPDKRPSREATEKPAEKQAENHDPANEGMKAENEVAPEAGSPAASPEEPQPDEKIARTSPLHPADESAETENQPDNADSSAPADSSDTKLHSQQPADNVPVKDEPSPDHTAVDASRKRRSRPGSHSGESPYVRNRKRRSREDEILQRVLEESAREAREAESRRRSEEGLPFSEEHAVKEDTPEDEPVAKRGRGRLENGAGSRKEGRNGVGRTTPRDADGDDQPTNGANGGSGSNGRRRGRTRTTDHGDGAPNSPSRRNGGAPRRSKPRVVSQRSTLDEMRRRVSAILDFSSRTQDELIDDQKTHIVALQPRDTDSEEHTKYEQLLQMSQANLGHLEDLTSQLLQWEEQFGIQGTP